MQSYRSRIFIWILKNRHLFKFKRKPEIVDERFSVIEFREQIDKVSARIKLPKTIHAEKVKVNAIEAEWIIPENALEHKVLLYIHGGGFISGSALTHRMHVAKFAKGSQLKSLVFNYRLAPENPFPAALDDCVEVYSWLLQQNYKPENIVVGGESAGATLTLSLLLALKEKSIALPKAAFSISPVTDLRCQADSFKFNAKNDIAPIGSWDLWTNYYIGNNNPTNPLLSPLFGNFKGLPPLFICVGTHEIHLNDCENVAKVAKDHGVEVTFKKWENMIHAFPILSPFFPEAKQALTEICQFSKNSVSLQK
ncbi:MAG: alpha/beta hydrolase [Bacteroidales bacterium]|nr:alpha/beta hydrolase [Bacteroidales bacterium]